MASLPVLIIMANSSIQPGGDSRAQRFVSGAYPIDSAILIVAALAALPIAALFLRRMSDRQLAISDDFSVEGAAGEGPTGRWDEWLLRFRDSALRHRLADAGFGWWAIQRWRIPAITSWAQLFIAVVLGFAAVAIANYDSPAPTAATAIGLIAAMAMLIAPVASWHVRRGSIAQEFMRPVSRGQYFRELALAFALDMILWTTLASIFVCAMAYFFMRPEPQVSWVILGPLMFLWPSAVFVYGTGLATFRMRYWLPVMVGILIGWTIVATFANAYFVTHVHVQYRNWTVFLIPASWALLGLLLAAFTLRRWMRGDVV